MFTNDELKNCKSKSFCITADDRMKLSHAKVLLIGVRNEGCSILQYLVADGIGMIGIVDGELVTEKSLEGQMLFGVGDVGKTKVEAAATSLKNLNNNVLYNCYPFSFDEEKIKPIVRIYDIVIDCSENREQSKVIEKCCIAYQKLLIKADIQAFSAKVGVLDFKNSDSSCAGIDKVLSNGEKSDSVDSSLFCFVSAVVGGTIAGKVVKNIIGTDASDRSEIFEISAL